MALVAPTPGDGGASVVTLFAPCLQAAWPVPNGAGHLENRIGIGGIPRDLLLGSPPLKLL